MTKTQKHLSFMALASLVFCGAAVFGASTNISKNMIESIKADNSGSYSVSFNRTICGNSGYNSDDFTKSSALQQSGITVYAHAVNSMVATGTDFARFKQDASAYIEFYIDSTANIGFQEISGFSFVYNSMYPNGDFDIYYSTDGSTYPASPNAEVRNAPASVSLSGNNVKKIKFAGLGNNYAYFNTITINYSCGEPAAKTLSSISLSGQTTSYSVGDSFSFDGTCTAHYTDGSSTSVTPSSVSSPDMSSSGVKEVTVYYSEGGINVSALYNINVESGSYYRISAGTYTTSATYCGSFTFSNDGTGSYTRTYSGSTSNVTFNWSCETGVLTFTSFTIVSRGNARIFLPCYDASGQAITTTSITLTANNSFSILLVKTSAFETDSKTADYSLSAA